MGHRNLSGYCPEGWKRYEEKEVGKMSLGGFGRRGGFRGGFYDAHSEVNRLIDEMSGGLGRRPGARGHMLWSEPRQWTCFKRTGT